jgi:hypothetical protein
MTEAEWHTTIRFRKMCRFVFDAAADGPRVGAENRVRRWLSGLIRGRTRVPPPTPRKLLLLIAGCGRCVWQDAGPGSEKRVWVERTERCADGAETVADMESLAAWAGRSLPGAPGSLPPYGLTLAFPYGLALANPVELWESIDVFGWGDPLAADRVDQYFGKTSGNGCTVIRDVIGNPFSPVTVEPGWLTPTVTELARGIYEGRAFDRLPILADALQDAGCDHADVLGHCRGSGPHVRGCWVVDLVLGKS